MQCGVCTCMSVYVCVSALLLIRERLPLVRPTSIKSIKQFRHVSGILWITKIDSFFICAHCEPHRHTNKCQLKRTIAHTQHIHIHVVRLLIKYSYRNCDWSIFKSTHVQRTPVLRASLLHLFHIYFAFLALLNFTSFRSKKSVRVSIDIKCIDHYRMNGWSHMYHWFWWYIVVVASIVGLWLSIAPCGCCISIDRIQRSLLSAYYWQVHTQ